MYSITFAITEAGRSLNCEGKHGVEQTKKLRHLEATDMMAEKPHCGSLPLYGHINHANNS